MIHSEPWGAADGRPVELYALTGGHGMTVRIATYGAAVQSIEVPDRFGETRNVALGFASLDPYVANQARGSSGPSGVVYFGATVGRYANRIAGHAFTLDGRSHELAANDGSQDGLTVHGGPGAYSAQVWEAAPVDAGPGVALRLRYVDPAGRNGFPGTVENEVVYSLTADNALRIDYSARTDAPTVINLTNHTYFNLAGEGAGEVYDQWLALNAEVMQPSDEAQIPTGFAAVAGTPFDFRTIKPIGRDIGAVNAPRGEQLVIARGYDHNWVLRGAGYRLAAVAFDPGSGIVLRTYTDQPAVQFYSGNVLGGELIGTGGRAYHRGGGFALETQHFPDSPQHLDDPRWPSVVLRPGADLRTRTTYRFGVAGPELIERIRF
ncbi:MAG: galactose mutarotase [Solirubrobacterales bacterium]|nr:galactose mutarotase [Solirubrobacterales bacterium]